MFSVEIQNTSLEVRRFPSSISTLKSQASWYELEILFFHQVFLLGQKKVFHFIFCTCIPKNLKVGTTILLLKFFLLILHSFYLRENLLSKFSKLNKSKPYLKVNLPIWKLEEETPSKPLPAQKYYRNCF